MSLEKLKNFNFEKLKAILTSDVSSLKRKTKGKEVEKRAFSNKVVSIDIGSNKTKIVVGRYQKNKIAIDKLFMLKTPIGTIEDGNITNSLNLSIAIERTLIGLGVKVKDGVCTSNSTSIINRDLLIPMIEEEEMDTLIQYEIQQYLPINMNDYIVQHNLVEQLKVEDTDKYKVLVVTYPNRMAKQYYELLTAVKLKPVNLDVTYNSIKKLINSSSAVNGVEYNRQDTIAFIDMGAENLNVNIYTNQQMEFTRIIKSGGNAMDQGIARIFDITLEEAEKRKIQFGDLEENFKEEAMQAVLREVAEEWMEELGRILQFYKNKKVGNKIDKIYIHGGGSKLKGLKPFMEQRLNVSVDTVESLDSIELSKNIPQEEIYSYLNAIGAIIRF